MDFHREETLQRYSRQVVLPDVGPDGQRRLHDTHVLVVGAGGLGCPVLTYLCSAGIGRLTVYDHDTVERSNLHRQTLFREDDLGTPKPDAVIRALDGLNPDCSLDGINQRVDEDLLRDVLSDVHIVVDGSDNFETKFLVNDVCVQKCTPAVIGGILRHRGQVLSVLPDESACYRCLFESPPPDDRVPDCSEAGVLGPVAGMVGAAQAYEVLKLVLQFGEPLLNRLLEMNLDRMSFRTVEFDPNPDCDACEAVSGRCNSTSDPVQ